MAILQHRDINASRITNWKGDAAADETKRKRARRWYSLTGVVCEKCGAPAADRHHRDGDVGNNEPSNIAPLCRRCHQDTDGRLTRLHAISKEFNKGIIRSAETRRKLSEASLGRRNYSQRRLTTEQVTEIRSLCGLVSIRALAVRFSVGKTTIEKIQQGKRYAEITTFAEGTR